MGPPFSFWKVAIDRGESDLALACTSADPAYTRVCKTSQAGSFVAATVLD